MRITISHEHMTKMGELFMQVIVITDSESSEGESLEDANLLAGVMVGGRVKVKVSVGGLTINLATERPINLPDKKDIEERQLMVRFELFGEGNVGDQTVDVRVKFFKVRKPMWPANITVINAAFPPFGFEGEGMDGHLLKMLHEKVGNDRGEGGTHGYPINFLIEDILEREEC